MSAGMAIPITIFAYLGWLGRSGLLRRLKDNETAIKKAGMVVEVVGFAILFVFAVYIALPFINGVSGMSL